MSNFMKNEGGLVIISYDDSVYFDNAAWDESQIMMYIKLHSFHFHPQIPPSSLAPPSFSRPNDSFMGNVIRQRVVKTDKHQLVLIVG